MAIDNPLDAYEKQYPKPEFDPLTLTTSITKHIPVASAIMQAIDTVRNALTGVSMNERLHAMWEVLRLSFEGLETRTDKTGVDLEEFKASIRIAFARDALEQSDKKRDRYVKILGNAIVSDSRIDELTSFILDVERLRDTDVTVLKVLCTVMNKPKDWVGLDGRPINKLHPNTFIQRRKELAVEIAKTLGNHTAPGIDGSSFDHEPGYEACARLQGFGLAHEIDVSAREVPIGDYCFRPTKRGLLMVSLLGESAPNMDKY